MSADSGERVGVSPPSAGEGSPPTGSQSLATSPTGGEVKENTSPLVGEVAAKQRVGDGTNTKRRRLVLSVLLGVLLVGFAVWFFFFREVEPRNDAERLVGEWQITIAGRPTPNAVIVSGDRWEHHGGKAYRVTLNETADPREITLEQVDGPRVKGPPVKMHGVYVFESSNKLRIRVRPGTEPRPKTLDDPDAPEWVLTRVKLEPVPQPGR